MGRRTGSTGSPAPTGGTGGDGPRPGTSPLPATGAPLGVALALATILLGTGATSLLGVRRRRPR